MVWINWQAFKLLLRPIRCIYCNYATKDTLSKLLKTRNNFYKYQDFKFDQIIRKGHSIITVVYQHGVLVMRADNHWSYPLPPIEIEITSCNEIFGSIDYKIVTSNFISNIFWKTVADEFSCEINKPQICIIIGQKPLALFKYFNNWIL